MGTGAHCFPLYPNQTEDYMTASQAAIIIGCCTAHVRLLIRRNRMPATIVTDKQFGRHYEVSIAAVIAYRDTQQTRGYPRGKARSK